MNQGADVTISPLYSEGLTANCAENLSLTIVVMKWRQRTLPPGCGLCASFRLNVLDPDNLGRMMFLDGRQGVGDNVRCPVRQRV